MDIHTNKIVNLTEQVANQLKAGIICSNQESS